MSKPSYGGQAVIEGVMIRGQRHYAVAVRDPQGNIITHTEALTGRIYGGRWLKTPLIRGPLVLWDSLSLGLRTLMFSAQVALTQEEGEGEKVEFSDKAMWGTMVAALAFAIGLFFVAPAFVMSAFLDNFLGSALASNVVEKVIRLGLVVGYIYLIGRMRDIQRVFSYHGAEHKAIHAHEAGLPLTVENAQRFSTAHTRCGTSFLLVVMVFSLFAFMMLGQPPMLERLLSRVLLVPVVAAFAYEFIKLAAAHEGSAIMRALLAPGLWLQKLTTREPDDSMVEVALAAVEAAIAADAKDTAPAPALQLAEESVEVGASAT